MFDQDHPRLYTLLWTITVLAVAAVLGGFVWFLYKSDERSGREQQQRYASCLEQGGAWVEENNCVYDQNGAVAK